MKKPIPTKSCKSALLVIDMLNNFVLSGAPLEIPRAKQIVPTIKSHIETARYLGWLVVYVCDRHEESDKEFEKWPKHAVKETSVKSVKFLLIQLLRNLLFLLLYRLTPS